MRKLAVLSFHTSPLAQPGTGDGGGMNVYVRELSAALARAGVICDVYTRASAPGLAERVQVEPGLTVHHVVAGPTAEVPKAQLRRYVDDFTDAVDERMDETERRGGGRAEAIHANYWLSGIAGHALKHRRNLPLVSTFHTLDRVKAEANPDELDAEAPGERAAAEAAVIGCSDAVLASCSVEVDQLVELYGADRDRVEVISPGVDQAFFSPGDRAQARRALGLAQDSPLALFVGRIQPLKGADVAVRALALLKDSCIADARLVIVGGPSGRHGEEELLALRGLVAALGLEASVRFVDPVPHELLSSYYRAADCGVVPSRSESFGLVALEAAACGIPVVAAAVGGLTTLIEHGETGYLVEGGEVEGFAAHLGELFCTPERAQALGAAAATRARAYTWPLAAARLRRLYGELTDRALVECS